MSGAKGSTYERELMNLAAADGWKVIRATASGAGTTDDRPDILIGHPTRGVFAFEAKFRKSDTHLYVGKDEVESLKNWAEAFGATPLIAARWKGRTAWEFYDPELLPTTEKNYKVKALGKRHGPNGRAWFASCGGLNYADLRNYHTRTTDLHK